jgi:NAD(P)H-quinone oxidoreductase subunit 5
VGVAHDRSLFAKFSSIIITFSRTEDAGKTIGMTDLPPLWPSVFALAALAVPVTYGLAATFVSPRRPFRGAGLAAAAGLAFALVAAAAPLWPGAARGAGALVLGPRLDGVTGVLLALVALLGGVLVRFSAAYLDGDGGRSRYARWLMATLAAVSTLLVADHLLVIALAWTATGLSLHRLLTFYADRPRALVAAHKKFLLSRAADLCNFAAIGLIGLEVGSLRLGDVNARAAEGPLPASLEAAAALLAVGASIKCAQLPFQGWLIDVMEAPTPVSALLHAGVVNVGGVVLIRLAPLLARAELASTLLVVIGTATAVLAALVMATRASIKVALAWSTCAQMGLMLVECGLGAYDLALLHLIGHSLYKAHAFLSSGSAVDRWRAQALAARGVPPGVAHWAAAAVALVGAGAVAAALGAGPGERPAAWALAAVLGLGLAAPAAWAARQGPRRLAVVGLGAAAAAALYAGWHEAFGRALWPAGAPPAPLRSAFVAASFGALFAVQAALRLWPEGRLARVLYPRLFAGLYLDEIFTRITFRVWPPTLPPRRAPAPRLRVTKTIEV